MLQQAKGGKVIGEAFPLELEGDSIGLRGVEVGDKFKVSGKDVMFQIVGLPDLAREGK